jgi:hypothetical protein
MKTNTETVQCAFSHETSFTIALHAKSDAREQADGAIIPHRFALPPEDKFTRPCIPESALHD